MDIGLSTRFFFLVSFAPAASSFFTNKPFPRFNDVEADARLTQIGAIFAATQNSGL